MAETPRILIIRTDRIGDVVLSTPVIRALRKATPHAYIGMMVRPEHRELVEGNPALNTVILYDKNGTEKGWAGNLRFARKLREHRFDTAVILHSTNRVILVSWLAGIRKRIGYARRLGWLLTDKIPYIKKEGNRHELDYNLELLRLIGIDPSAGSGQGGRELFVPVTPAQEIKVAAFLKAQGIDGAPFFVLHPGASCPSKRWPAKHFAAVGDELAKKPGTHVVVLTGPGEERHGQAVIAAMKQKAVPALGVLSLGETACLLKKARCLVSNDSGPVHLGSAVGTPVVSIFGRWGGGLSPARWGPTGPRSVALHHDIGCRPCLAHQCTIGFACLETVMEEEVLAAVEHVASS
ncbi:MAG: glycosyltransferase family 9 protein [Candidatus Omnitrophota bacterium]|nr:glycosyltransferase family 9 protein [Candidatus Omnitrophota bacterium]